MFCRNCACLRAFDGRGQKCLYLSRESADTFTSLCPEPQRCFTLLLHENRAELKVLTVLKDICAPTAESSFKIHSNKYEPLKSPKYKKKGGVHPRSPHHDMSSASPDRIRLHSPRMNIITHMKSARFGSSR